MIDLKNKFVSIIMPTYNRANIISDSISSVLNQTHTFFEFIIIDDGSTDETSSVVNAFNDERIFYTKIKHSGLPAVARNYGAGISHGDLLAFIDDDDLWMVNKLKKCLQIKSELNDQIAIICSNEYYMDADGNKSNILLQTNYESHYIRPENLIFENIVSSSTVVLERKIFDEVGGFSQSSDYKAVEDYHLWLTINCNNLIYYYNEPLGYYRNHADSIRFVDHFGMQREINVLLYILCKYTSNFVNNKYFIVIHVIKLYKNSLKSCIKSHNCVSSLYLLHSLKGIIKIILNLFLKKFSSKDV
jgi:glycosyltransferase involved in cell wall biosynthesis